MENRLYTGEELADRTLFIEKLLTAFADEATPFFGTLNEAETKQLRRYLEYRKATNQENWTFAAATYQMVASIDAKAQKFYEDTLRYRQLALHLGR